jgi:flagellar protein FlaG
MATVSTIHSQTSLPQVPVLAATRADLGAVASELKTDGLAGDANKPEVQTSTSKTVKQAAKALSKEELASQVQALQAKMDKLNPALAFVVDQTTGKALIQLTDRATKEVILQFPSEAALQITRALDRFQKGQLVSRAV